jgi:two-component system, OmpR family, alkaline phosphatase synthesis response regulator PhoP
MIKVLIAEDEKDIRRLVSFVLTREGYTVIEASDGKEALETAEKENPDIILLDVMMPQVDGYEVCRRLRANPAFSDTPLLLLSAKGQTYEIGEGLRAGATDYLVKPFAPRDLATKVKQMLGEPPAPQ